MPFSDLREYLDVVESKDHIKRIDGADWNLEIGAITELVSKSSPHPPMLLFDKIKDYKPGYRVISNVFNSNKRISLALGLDPSLDGVELAQAWKKYIVKLSRVPPREVSDGPIMENVIEGDNVDMFQFPTPKWHDLDGGRFIGTGCMVITRDPDDGWVNAGAYRSQIFNKNTIGCHAPPKQHVSIMRSKYWAKGQSCPVVLTFGQEPVTYLFAGHYAPWGVSEFDYAGWARGKPVDVIIGKHTGLPIPATAEIAVEGEMLPPKTETAIEGPFGEYTGYYGTGSIVDPVIKVKSIMFRNNPIQWGSPPMKPHYSLVRATAFIYSAHVWDALEKTGLGGIKSVWVPEAGATFVTVISMKQTHPGHSKAIGHIAAGLPAGTTVSRYVITVDEDIDPTNLSEVFWALTTRCDPDTGMDFVRGVPDSPIDPIMSPEKKEKKEYYNTVVVIDACKPFTWSKQFPAVNAFDNDYLKQTSQKWQRQLGIAV